MEVSAIGKLVIAQCRKGCFSGALAATEEHIPLSSPELGMGRFSGIQYSLRETCG